MADIKSFEEICEFFRKDAFATKNGMYLISAAPGDATVAVDICDNHRNAVGGVQGGVMFTLADFAFAVAANCGGKTVVSVQSSISFMHAARGTRLFAHAVERSSARKLAFYDVEVTDESGEVIASVSVTGYVK